MYRLIILLAFFMQCATTEYVKQDYVYPTFYKGIYMNISPRSKSFTQRINYIKRVGLNAVVLDAWAAKTMFSSKQIKYCYDNDIHAIARIVMKYGGFKTFSNIDREMRLIELACQRGFKEIQLDYIRFEDKKNIIANFVKIKYINIIVSNAKAICKKYNVRLAVDIFGRIPFAKRDRIGQDIEKLDKIVDVICPMAYPSYYHKNNRNKEYALLKNVIKKSKSRTSKAKIVLWIQGFKHKTMNSNFHRFIKNQINACIDAKADGFIVWNPVNRYNALCTIMQDLNIAMR